MSNITFSTNMVKQTFTGIKRSQEQYNKITERLATGKRINKASDDIGGLMLHNELKGEDAVYRQAINGSDSASQQIKDLTKSLSALRQNVISRQKMSEDINSNIMTIEQRQATEKEFNALTAQYNSLAETHNKNTTTLNRNSKIQVGYNNATLDLANLATQIEPMTQDEINISSRDNANSSNNSLKDIANKLANYQKQADTISNRLTFTSNNLEKLQHNTEVAEQRIMQIDRGKELSDRLKYTISQEYNTAILAHNNLKPEDAAYLITSDEEDSSMFNSQSLANNGKSNFSKGSTRTAINEENTFNTKNLYANVKVSINSE